MLGQTLVSGMLFCCYLTGQENTLACMATRVNEAPPLNGLFEGSIWNKGSVVSGFVQSSPALGQPAKKRTEVRVLYDDHYLYIGARMWHPSGKASICKQMHRRDQSSNSDWFGVMLDSIHDHRSAFTFYVNASNVQKDGIWMEDNTEDLSWDGLWESVVKTDADGWTAQMKIPLSLLRFHTANQQSWGINFFRQDEGQEREMSYWVPRERGESAWVARFPHLNGLTNLNPQYRREFVPYVSTLRKFETAQPFDDRKWTHRAGLDVHLGLNHFSQLDLTLRPDFGQVEVDQNIFNLTTLESLFPEKRPFFLEGMEIFQTPGIKLFYSRRIGKGLGNAANQTGLTLQDWPQAVEITAAGKYTAKLSSGTSLGILGASLEKASATYLSPSGPIQQEVEPYTNAWVGHLTQSLGTKGSYVGLFGSWMQRAFDGRPGSTVWACDGAWKSTAHSLCLDGTYARSTVNHPEGNQIGNYLKVRLTSALGRGWVMEGQAFTASRGFNPNDLGYLDRPDQKGINVEFQKHWDREWSIFRNPILHLIYTNTKDQRGRSFTHLLDNWIETQFINSWNAYIGLITKMNTYNDRELRTFKLPEKKYLKVPASPTVYFGAETPVNWRWRVKATYSREWTERGRCDEYYLKQTIKPRPNLEFQLESNLQPVNGQWYYLESQGDSPIVGMRDLRYFSQGLRIAYALNHRLSFQLFTEYCSTNMRYDDLRRWVDENTLVPGVTPTVATVDSERKWNVNLITRWEFRPGSHLYLVYTHGVYTKSVINDQAKLRPLRDFSQLLHEPSNDSIQLKFSWLFR